jgi:general secretion pathway protein H
MGSTVEQAVPRTSRAAHIERVIPGNPQSGIVLLDLVLAMARLGFVMLMIMPSLPSGTTTARHGAYALEIAALLKSDRTAAARTGTEVATQVDVSARTIVSGATHDAVILPSDVTLDVIASDICNAGNGRFNIVFAADGRSCGAVIRIGKGTRDWRIRVNWLTGYIDVVAPQTG